MHSQNLSGVVNVKCTPAKVKFDIYQILCGLCQVERGLLSVVIKNNVSEFKVSTSFCNIQDFLHGNVVPLTLSRASCFSLMTCQLTNAVCIFQSKGKDFPTQ